MKGIDARSKKKKKGFLCFPVNIQQEGAPNLGGILLPGTISASIDWTGQSPEV